MKYQIVEVDGAQYMVNEAGKVKTSGTVRDGDGVKYKITKAQGEGYRSKSYRKINLDNFDFHAIMRTIRIN